MVSDCGKCGISAGKKDLKTFQSTCSQSPGGREQQRKKANVNFCVSSLCAFQLEDNKKRKTDTQIFAVCLLGRCEVFYTPFTNHFTSTFRSV